MVQVYFLIIVCNILMGVILSKEFFKSKFEKFSPFEQILSSEIFQVTIGCIGTIVGILALFFRFTGNMIVIGDLIPALVGIISGITLFVEYIAHEEGEDSTMILFFKKIFIKNKTILGLTAITSGILHFIIPAVELL